MRVLHNQMQIHRCGQIQVSNSRSCRMFSLLYCALFLPLLRGFHKLNKIHPIARVHLRRYTRTCTHAYVTFDLVVKVYWTLSTYIYTYIIHIDLVCSLHVHNQTGLASCSIRCFDGCFRSYHCFPNNFNLAIKVIVFS